jgi:hypothetical protein
VVRRTTAAEAVLRSVDERQTEAAATEVAASRLRSRVPLLLRRRPHGMLFGDAARLARTPAGTEAAAETDGERRRDCQSGHGSERGCIDASARGNAIENECGSASEEEAAVGGRCLPRLHALILCVKGPSVKAMEPASSCAVGGRVHRGRTARRVVRAETEHEMHAT